MKEAGTAVRTSIFNALSGSVVIDTDPVGVFDGKYESLAGIDEGVWIIVGEQQSTDRSLKNFFASEENVELIIANKSKSVAGKQVVESVADKVMEIIIPTPATIGLTIANPFHITFVKYDNSRASKVDQGVAKEFENIKTLNFLIRVTQ